MLNFAEFYLPELVGGTEGVARSAPTPRAFRTARGGSPETSCSFHRWSIDSLAWLA